MLYSHDTTIQIYRCRDIRSTDDSPLFRYGTFINFLIFLFFDTRREKHNFHYADCSHIAHCQPASWTGPAQSQISTNVFFEITKFSAHHFRAWRHSHPITFSIWGFYYDICYCHILCVRAWTVTNVCAPAPVLSQIVQSHTKPNDKM